MTNKQADFIELLLANGRRLVGGEIHGRRPADLADQVGLDRRMAIAMCCEWMAKGWYHAEEGYTLYGYVTTKGQRELRKLI